VHSGGARSDRTVDEALSDFAATHPGFGNVAGS
jgi:hypothetical protein